jgi:phosphoribosylamine--glycine ligase
MGFVMASKGYPGDYEKGFPIVIPENISVNCHSEERSDVRIYHMGTTLKDGQYYTSGGRVLMVVGFGADLQEAHDKALAAVESIECDNLFYRRDIGWRVL